MSALELIFSHDFDTADGTDGPQFFRYLPSREDGAIIIPIVRPEGQLKIWFERRGSTKGGWVSQNYRGEPLDLDRIRRQAIHTGGKLWGSFKFAVIEEGIVDELRLKKFGAPLGVALAQRVLRGVVNPHFVRAVESLRVLTGQYWLRPLYPWSGDPDSMGSYCQALQMHWRVPGGKAQVFYPTEPTTRLDRGYDGNPYLEIPDEQRWLAIINQIMNGYSPAVSHIALARAHQYRAEADWRLAFIEAVTALEIILHERIRTTVGYGEVSQATQAFFDLPFKAKLSTVCLLCSIGQEDIKLCLEGYRIRNDIAHEGASVTAEQAKMLDALLRVGRNLSSEPRILFPHRLTANEQRQTNEEWDEIPGPKYGGTVTISSIPPGFTDWVPPAES